MSFWRRKAAPSPTAFAAASRGLTGLRTDLATEDDVIGALGLQIDPDEALERAGIDRARLRVLEYDDEIYAALETRREAVLASGWRIEPEPESGAAGERAAERLWLWLEPRLNAFLREAWSAVPYGYSVIELVWGPDGDDGALLPQRLIGKPFEWFTPQRDGSLRYTRNGEAVPLDTARKFILTRRAPSYRQPRGEPLLSRLYWTWFLRAEGWKMWARHLERHGSPTLVGKIEVAPSPHPLSEAEQQAQTKQLTALLDHLRDQLDRSVRAASIATTADVAAIDAGNAGEAFSRFTMELAKRIQKVILGQTLTSDIQGGGSYAAAQVHNTVREDRLRADLRLLREAVQQVITAAAQLNGWPVPVFAFADAIDLQAERAGRDATLAQAGLISVTEQYLMRVYDFESGDLAPVQPPAPARLALPPQRFAAAAGARLSPTQQAVDEQVNRLVAASPQPVAPSALRAAIRAAKDPADLENRLAQVLDHADPEFAELLARAHFAAEVLGYLHAEGA